MKTKRMNRVLSGFVAILMLLSTVVFAIPASNAENSETICWKGAMNFNDSNNSVTDKVLPQSLEMTELKWSYPLNTTMENWGAYYAGTQVIADGYIYATGGGKLHKIDIQTGVGGIISEPGVTVGTYGNYYDYLCYADGVLIVATQKTIEAYRLDGKFLGSADGNFGYYHPVQYKDGYVICNGYIFFVEKGESFTFRQIGEGSIGQDSFNWNSGVFADNLFYTVSKNTVYAVNYKTNTVVDSFVFDESRTASMNVQPGVSYDSETSRLYFGTYSYDTFIHSVKVDTEEGENKGKFDKNSYIKGDAGQKSVCTPIVFNGRVYLAGQNGEMSVLNASDLTKVYGNTKFEGCTKIQSNPILSTNSGQPKLYVQGYNGHMYMFTDNGDFGTCEKIAETKNYTGVTYPNAYEQIAMDNDGRLYCYNESGYLFCFAAAGCQVPEIITDLSTETVKLQRDSDNVEALKITAYIPEDSGELSYQWQVSEDKISWDDIEDTNSPSFVPPTSKPGAFYYRCVVTNTSSTCQSQTVSSFANILVKTLSNNTEINVLVNASNSLSGGTVASNSLAATKVTQNIIAVENCKLKSLKNIWLGGIEESTITSFEIIQGLDSGRSQPTFTRKTSSNTLGDIAYDGYYRSNYYKLPIVAKAGVVAEDGITNAEYYIVIDSGPVSVYTVGTTGFVADNSFYDETSNKITFAESNQTVTLMPKTQTIGTGGADSPEWSWSSSDTTVAKVDSETGLVTCVGGGTAEITATYQQIKCVCGVEATAEKHKIHTYVDGKCSICGIKAPGGMAVRFTVIDKDNKAALSADGKTSVYDCEILVDDADLDGTVTLNDAFLKAHEAYSRNGKTDFSTEDSSYGPFITKFWGEETSNVAYMLNNSFAHSLLTPLSKNDSINAYFYRDTTDWSDIYTYIGGDAKAAINTDLTFSVHGLVSSGEVIPNGATVKIINSNGEESADMSCTVNAEGMFSLNFKEPGDYTIKVSGTASYLGQIWDYESNSYVDKVFNDSPVVLSQFKVEIFPQVKKTVYVTISTKSGEFAVNKNGEEMWRFPVTASDDLLNPDGNVTISDVLLEAHRQYHPDGVLAVSDSSFITKLWGENNGGNCSYFFNDVYMTGSGKKTGSNGREWTDKLLNTVVEDGDAFKIYSFQATDWRKGDLYTYFNPVSESAVAGVSKTFTLKKGESYGSNTLETSLVKVYNENKQEIPELASTVGENGTFSITFPNSGKYFVDVRTNGTNYVAPSRLIVYVNKGTTGTEPAENAKVYISVKDPNGRTYLNKTAYTMQNGETAYSLLKKTGLNVKSTTDHQYGGAYVEAIEGLGEFDMGSESGWMYRVNGEFPKYSASLYILAEGDVVEWLYTRDLGEDVGNHYSGNGGTSANTKPGDPSNSVLKLPVEVKASILNDVVNISSITIPKDLPQSGSVTLLIDLSEKFKSATGVALSGEVFSKILKTTKNESKVDGVEISFAGIDVKLDNAALAGIGSKTAGKNVVLTAKEILDINQIKDQNNTINVKNAKAFSLDIKSGNKEISDFGGGWTYITVLYEKEVLNGENVCVWYVEGDKSLIKTESVYDPKTKLVMFKIPQFSTCIISTEAAKSFADVSEEHWAYSYITDLTQKGILNGRETGFAPEENITRAELVAILSRINGEELPETKEIFNDVSKDSWYAKYVVWAANSKIVSGIGNDRFAPDEKITRQDVAVMLLRYADYIKMNLKGNAETVVFSDENEISDYANKAVELMQKTGIISGTPDGKFLPQDAATRAEAAKMLSVFLDIKEGAEND